MTRSILIVDDDPTVQVMVGKILEKMEIPYAIAENGQKAIDAVVNEPPELMLLDVNMPGISGLTALERIRELPGGYWLSVVLLTANSDRQSVLKAASLRACDFLVKPFTPAELTDRVEKNFWHLSLKEMKLILENLIYTDAYLTREFGHDPISGERKDVYGVEILGNQCCVLIPKNEDPKKLLVLNQENLIASVQVLTKGNPAWRRVSVGHV